VGITKDFDLRLRICVAEGFEGRQRQNEIAKRAAANDEEALNNG
jgi:hypothetical protein